MKPEKLLRPTKEDMLADYGQKDPNEVYEFEAFPEIDYGSVSWSGPLITCGPRYVLAKTSPRVRVAISKDVPREGAIKALKDIVSMLETCGSSGENVPQLFTKMSLWFDE